MQLVIVLIAVAVIGLAALVAAGWFGEQPAEPIRDVYQPPLADEERLGADDLADVRFGVTPMGYDMSQVDEWMARMARELDGRETDALDGDASARGQDVNSGHEVATAPEPPLDEGMPHRFVADTE